MLNKFAVNFTQLVQKRDRWWILVYMPIIPLCSTLSMLYVSLT